MKTLPYILFLVVCLFCLLLWCREVVIRLNETDVTLRVMEERIARVERIERMRGMR